MPAIIPGYEYDIFISYRQKDNKGDRWVTEFVKALRTEVESAFKEDVTIYFDENPHDGVLETHDVDRSLRDKLKCLIFIPVISRTFCDVKSFAWNHEFLEFIKIASGDAIGINVKLPNGNTASRILPVRIHELDAEDKKAIEEALHGPLRAIDFTYHSAGVNRPLRPQDAESLKGINQATYRDQVNKVANAIRDLIDGMQGKTVNTSSHTGNSVEALNHLSANKPKIKIPALSKSQWVNVGLFVTLTIVFLLRFSEKVTEPQLIKSSLISEEGVDFNMGTIGSFAVAPDGKSIAYVATDSTNKSFLWLRDLDKLHATRLADSDGAYLPFWSPDSRNIGFFAQAKLRRISVDGGPSQTLCDVSLGRGGSWNNEDVIIFSPDAGSNILSIPAKGGRPFPCTSLKTNVERSHRFPYFLPDGKHFLYTCRKNLALKSEADGIMIASLDTTFIPRVVGRFQSNAQYANGYLLFTQGEALLAQPFDLNKFELTGTASHVAENLYYETTTFHGSFSISQTGVLVYHSLSANVLKNILTWHDRNGKPMETIGFGKFGNYVSLRLSPDGNRIAFCYYDQGASNANQDIWLYDLQQNAATRFTFDKAIDRTPLWSPDGKRVVFTSNRNNDTTDIFQRNADGKDEEKLLVHDADALSDWSKDGRFILSWRGVAKNSNDIWVHPVGEKHNSGESYAFLATEFAEDQAVFSPDGHWIAYRSNENGSSEIYIRPFPGPGGKWQISSMGATRPHWRADGKELFYLSNDFKIMAVDIASGAGNLRIGATKALFAIHPISVPLSRDIYNVTADGEKFLVESFLGRGATPPLTLVTPWPSFVAR